MHTTYHDVEVEYIRKVVFCSAHLVEVAVHEQSNSRKKGEGSA